MAKVRVYELAKEMGITSKKLIKLLMDEFEIKVKNHMSSIDSEDAELIRELYENKGKEEKKQNKNDEHKDKNTQNKKPLNNTNTKTSKSSKESNKNSIKQEQNNQIEIDDTITVKELSEKLNKPSTEVIKQLIFMGIMANINNEIDFNIAQKLGKKFNVTVVKKQVNVDDMTTKVYDTDEEDINEEYTDAETEKRPPIVTVMGHVDHGKTSLLDVIRRTNVTSTEAGGITQHIGAYTVKVNSERITFLDTPGHEAFTAMRARGAQITDIVILVVAADDGVMPQTKEAINHCKAANVPIIVAINKIDKEGANPDRVKQELADLGLIPEEWGGDTICVPVSARKKIGINDLLEMVILTAEMLELKANSKRKGKGIVIESKLDKGRGPVATLLVQDGTLHSSDSIIVGTCFGRIRAMFDDKGNKIKEAGPSIPVEVLGLSDVPIAGDKFNVVKDEKTARNIAEKREQKLKEKKFQTKHKVSLEDLYSQIQEGKVKELDLIVKADVQGSVEALTQSFEKLSTESIKVRVIHSAVGAINETDVILASASNAIIIGFNVRPDIKASSLAEKDNVDIKTYNVIYDAIDDIKSAMEGMLEPEYKEVIIGTAVVKQTYKISSVGTVAGCLVQNGKIVRNGSARIIRNGVVVFDSKISSLKRFKDDVKEVQTGYECGIMIENFNDIKTEDIIEVYQMEEIKK